MLRPQPVDETDATLAAAKAAAVDERRPSGNLALSIGSGYLVQVLAQATTLLTRVALARIIAPTQWGVFGEAVVIIGRSEERRVGKECGARGPADPSRTVGSQQGEK